MDKLFCDLPFVVTYLDDVLIHSSIIDKHKKHLKLVFDRIDAAGLILHGSKCNIGMYQVKYLGHAFSSNGIESDPVKTSVVCDWPTPVNVSNLHSFLGLASYYHHYIHKFSDIAAPLHQLTNKGISFDWNESCQVAFNQLKQKLTQAPVLAYPAFGPSATQFVLQTDASSTGIGAVLEQNGHVVAYTSRTLSSTERNYSMIQRECLAIIFVLNNSNTTSLVTGSYFSLTTLPYSGFQGKNGGPFSKVGISYTGV